MYRVELKVLSKGTPLCLKKAVPNVPCGVERRIAESFGEGKLIVPNVPCGVERHTAWA